MCSCRCAEISQCSLTHRGPEPSESPRSDAGSILCSLFVLCAHRSCSQVKVRISISVQAPEGTGVFYSFLYPKHLLHNTCSVSIICIRCTELKNLVLKLYIAPAQSRDSVKVGLVANLRMWVILLGRILLPPDAGGRRLRNVSQIQSCFLLKQI